MTITFTDNTKDSPIGKFAHKAWQFALGIGILTVVFGGILLAWPVPTILVLGGVFGVYLLLSGIVEVLLGFSPHPSTWVRVISVFTGILSIGLGVLCFRDQLESVLLLGVWIGAGWISTGIGRIATAASTPFPGRGMAIVTGILRAIAGGVMIIWPIHSVAMLSLVAGVWMIILGVAQIIDAIQLRRSASKAGADLNTAASEKIRSQQP